MKALIIVDLQNDFVEGGSLPAKGAKKIIPVVNQLILKFPCVVGSKDWHPIGHASFASTHHMSVDPDKHLWPDHCIQNTWGSEYAEGLDAKKIQKTIYKGTQKNSDSYSAFFESENDTFSPLDLFLKEHHIKEIFTVGLVLEYCVAATARDALRLGYRVNIIKEGVVALFEGQSSKYFSKLRGEGISILSVFDI